MADLNFSMMDDNDSAIIFKEDGTYEILIPEDETALTIQVVNVILKMLKSEHLTEYVLKYEEGDEVFNTDEAEKVWH